MGVQFESGIKENLAFGITADYLSLRKRKLFSRHRTLLQIFTFYKYFYDFNFSHKLIKTVEFGTTAYNLAFSI